MSETLFRVVNGVLVELSEEEADAIRAEWAANAAAPRAIPGITQRQLALWLLRNGITEDMVEAAIAQIPDARQRGEALIEWRKSNLYERDHPFVSLIGAMLGFSPEQMDAGWREAGTI
jgi:hypothetical protein